MVGKGSYLNKKEALKKEIDVLSEEYASAEEQLGHCAVLIFDKEDEVQQFQKIILAG